MFLIIYFHKFLYTFVIAKSLLAYVVGVLS